MRFACIKNGKVDNVIVASLEFIEAGHLDELFDHLVDITDLTPQPGRDWSYDGNTFTDTRPVSNPTLSQIIDASILAAQAFGEKLILQFMNENVQLGISANGGAMVKPVADYCHAMTHYLGQGSMRAAIAQIETMKSDLTKGYLAPYVTNTRLDVYLGYINTYMGL